MIAALSKEDLLRAQRFDPWECRQYLLQAMKLGLNPRDDSTVQLIVARGGYDGRFFGRVFMGDTLKDPDSHQHDKAWSLLDDDSLPRVTLMAWRGFGKTTLGVVKTVQGIVYRRIYLAMIVGSAENHATEITESVKGELIDNDLIRYCFGDMKADSVPTRVRKRLGRNAWMVYDPATGAAFAGVLPKGAGQRVRGTQMRIRGVIRRPDWIVVDDIEDDQEVLNEDIRRARREWFNGALKECVPKIRPSAATDRWTIKQLNEYGRAPWRMLYADTLKHQDANIAHIINSSQWHSVSFPMATLRKSPPEGTAEKFQPCEYEDSKPRYYSEVPEIITTAQVRREIAQSKEDGVFETYCLEKLCLPVSPEGASWTAETFKYYSEKSERMAARNDLVKFIMIDPARTVKPTSAFSAILAVAVDCGGGKVYFRRLINRRMEVMDLINTAFDVALDMDTRVIGVELTGFETLKYLMETERTRRGLSQIQIVSLDAHSAPRGGDFGSDRHAPKRARASMLAPYYHKGVVYHEDNLRNSPLEQQMLSFPKCTHWDALDCAAYFPEMLKKGGHFFAYLEATEDLRERARQSSWDAEYQDIGARIRQRSWVLS